MKITHTDLKPENILLVDSESYETYTDDEYKKPEEDENDEKEDDINTNNNSKISNNLYIVPKNDKIKIIDLGGI